MKPKFIVGILAAIAVMTLTVKVTTERDGYLGDLLQNVDIFESFAPAPTTDTTVGRLELVHPDLGHDGGVALHTKVRDAWTKISDNMNSRYQEYSGVADSAVTTYRHNFGVAFTEVTVLIYTGSGTNLTRVTTVGQAGDYQVAANGTNPKLDIDITAPTSGGPHDFAVIVIHGSAVEVLDNLNDVDVTTTAPEDGQALVYDATGAEWVPGASGDASLKCQDVTDPNVTIKSGNMWIRNGQEVQVASDLTVSLDTILGSDPADDTTYYLYIDLDALAAPTLTATGRSVRLLTTASELALLTTVPEDSQLSRYVPLCKIHSADSGTVWSGTGADFETLSFRIFEGPSVNVSPTVYELAKQSQGEPGIINNTQGALADSFFPNTTTLHYYHLNGDSLDDSGNGVDLTTNGSPKSTGLGFFGRKNIFVLEGAGSGDFFTATSADFGFTTGTDSISVGGWFFMSEWDTALDSAYFNIGDATTSILLKRTGTPQINLSGQGLALNIDIPETFTPNTWHHIALTIDASNNALVYLDGKLAGSDTVNNAVVIPGGIGVGVRLVDNANLLPGSVQDFFTHKNTVLTAAQINSIYSRRFQGNQLAGGHVLTDDSFPISGTRVSYYNLSDENDSSTNSRNLTINGSPVFTGTSITGQSNTYEGTAVGQSLQTTDSFFFNLNTFTAGIWLQAAAPPATKEVLSSIGTVTNDSWRIQHESSGDLIVRMNFGTIEEIFRTPLTNAWRHIVLSYDSTIDTAKIYIDGQLAGTHIASSNLIIGGGTPHFTVCGGVSGTDSVIGKCDEAFFADYVMSDAEIKRLYSAKLTHNKNVAVENQTWLGSFWNETNNLVGEFDQDWIVHKNNNSIFIDPALPAGSQLSLKMQNHSFTSTNVPVETYTTGKLSSAPSFPIAHGLPCTPKDFYVLTEGQTTAADWDKRYDLLSADATEITGDVSSLTISASERIEIVASCAPVGVALDLENADLLITQNLTSNDLIVGAGKTLFRPNVEIASGHTITVQSGGTFNTVGSITGAGTLAGTGTVSSIDEQQVYPLDKTFQGDVTVNGTIKGDAEIKVPIGASCGSGNVCSGVESLAVTSSGGCNVTGDRGEDKWMRVGNVVMIGYSFDFSNITTSSCQLEFEIPAAGFSDFDAAQDASCTIGNNNVYLQPLSQVNISTNQIRVTVAAVSGGPHGGTMNVNCIYHVQPNI